MSANPIPSWPVVEVASPHELVREAGKYKFNAGLGSQVVYRGHSALFSNCMPSGIRGSAGGQFLNSLTKDLNSYVDQLMESNCTCPAGTAPFHCPEKVPKHSNSKPGAGLISGTPRSAVEPLLQHYGLKTRWVDVVDNIWIALWFACHEFIVDTEVKRYAHHLRRSVAQEPAARAFVSILSTGSVTSFGLPGCWEGQTARLIDLRVAAPSLYLRPHAQHGLLIASKDWGSKATIDVGPLHQVTLKIRLVDALSWLGDGTMLRPFVLFPPATEDHGYRRLLEYSPPPPKRLGKYIIVGPGN
jgi:hypothetical protein